MRKHNKSRPNKTESPESQSIEAFNKGKQADFSAQLIPLLTMIHVVNIMPDRVFLNFDPIKDDWQERLPDGSKVIPESKSEVIIAIGFHKTVLRSMKVGNRWLVVWIKADTTRLLYGHSGISVDNDEAYFKVLTYLNQTLNRYIDTESQDRALPGLVEGCYSYFSRLEINVQFGSERGITLLHFANMKPKHAKNITVRYDKDSVTHSAQERKICMYRKGAQLENRYGYWVSDKDKDVCRIEITLSKGKNRESFGLEKYERLAAFSLNNLYQAFRHNMRCIEGVFYSEKIGRLSKATRHILFLMKKGVLDQDIYEAVQDYVQSTNVTAKTGAEIEREIRKAWANVHALRFNTLFPRELPKSRQVVPLMRRKDEHGNYTKKKRLIRGHYDKVTIDPRIVEAYSTLKTVNLRDYEKSQASFIPHLQRKEFMRRMEEEVASYMDDDDSPQDNPFPTPPDSSKP